VEIVPVQDVSAGIATTVEELPDAPMTTCARLSGEFDALVCVKPTKGNKQPTEKMNSDET
jgi:hypothetical protein